MSILGAAFFLLLFSSLLFFFPCIEVVGDVLPSLRSRYSANAVSPNGKARVGRKTDETVSRSGNGTERYGTVWYDTIRYGNDNEYG